MSMADPSQGWYRVQPWHRQSMDAPVEDTSAIESLLEQAIKDTQAQGKLALLIKQRIWLADTQRMQGNHPSALSLYELLLNLTVNPDLAQLFSDDALVKCVARAYIGFVEIRRFFLPEEQLLQKIDEGLQWLSRIDRLDCGAGLLLQKGLLLKIQGRLKEASEEMRDALRRKQRSPEAPGYPLATHLLELADLLCINTQTIYAETAQRIYGEAAHYAQTVIDTAGNSTYDRRWAYQILAYARMELGEPEAALNASQQAQTLTYSLESADVLTAMNQHLARLSREVERMLGAGPAPPASVPDDEQDRWIVQEMIRQASSTG
jgi:tetratricopeptide (TPR) repeat protein